MVSYFPPKKSLLLAGVFGIIPGAGHLYNEQIGKGIFLLALFFGAPILVLMSAMDFHIFPFMSMGVYHTPLIQGFGHNSFLFTRILIILIIFVFIPILVIYSIADAISTAAKINRGEIPLGGYPSMGTPPPPPDYPMNAQTGFYPEEAMQMNTSNTAGTATANTFPEAEPQPQSADPANDAGPVHSSNQNHASKHGKLALGIILIGFGFFFMADDMNIPFLEFENILYYGWPLLPLFLGLRLLREYSLEKNHSQKILGTIFTTIGAIFILTNWLDIEVFDIIGDNWYFVPILIGGYILIKEFSGKRDKKPSANEGENS